jgi:hypothetical protein
VIVPIASMTSLHHLVVQETRRGQRSGRGFTVVRVAPVGWVMQEPELTALERFAEAQLRRTDFVQRSLPHREVGVVLVETLEPAARVPIERVRAALLAQFPALQFGIGWCSVGPGQRRGWEEAWRWAGTMLVADVAIPAAA